MQPCTAFLREAFETLELDQPTAFFRTADCLDGITVKLDVDGERFTAGFLREKLLINQAISADNCKVEAFLTRKTILDLCDGRLSLIDAVMNQLLQVRGNEQLLLRVAQAVSAFTAGAVRAKRMRALLNKFRREFTN
jgi:hypothetical protein